MTEQEKIAAARRIVDSLMDVRAWDAAHVLGSAYAYVVADIRPRSRRARAINDLPCTLVNDIAGVKDD